MAEHASDKISLTRRQAVAALGTGVVVVGGAAAATGLVATDWAQKDAQVKLQDLQFQIDELNKKNDEAQKQLAAAQLQLTAAQVQIEIYKGLTGLYDTLDKIGLDSIVGTALGAYKASLDALQGGVAILREGIVRAESALDGFENAFASIRNALTTAETAWANVNALLKNIQELIAQATSPLLPLVDGATKFFDDLLGKIPFGAGEGARQTIRGFVGLAAALPSALHTLDEGLFRTLREGWFSEDSARNVEATLSKPLVNGLFQPARGFLDQVDQTLNAWEGQVATPVNDALAKREIVQKQIAEYKTAHDMS